jgi:hypothetical protein
MQYIHLGAFTIGVRTSGSLWIVSLVATRIGQDAVKRKLLFLSGIEALFLDRAALNLVTTVTELPRLLSKHLPAKLGLMWARSRAAGDV